MNAVNQQFGSLWTARTVIWIMGDRSLVGELWSIYATSATSSQEPGCRVTQHGTIASPSP